MTEACSDLSGSLANVSWFAVPDAPKSYFSVSGNRIVLSADSRLDGGHVRHEMLHALLRAGGHPRQYFLERCGGVVNCDESCIADAEPPPRDDPNTARVTPEELEVSFEVAPASPSHAENGGFFTVTVKAQLGFASGGCHAAAVSGFPGSRFLSEYRWTLWGSCRRKAAPGPLCFYVRGWRDEKASL